MISRIITKVIIPTSRMFAPSGLLSSRPRFNFGKVQKVRTIKTIIEDEIKSERQNLNNLASYEKEFSSAGWLMSRTNILLQLHKKIGEYDVRLLSNIKPPAQFDENEQQQKKQADQQQNNQQMNEVTILVTKSGSEKTMVITTIVTEGFQINNIHFSPNYKQAKARRMEIFNSNNYIGPQMQTISDELFQSIYSFIENLGINTELMESFADYCLESEQNFYIQWLQDFKAIL